MNKPIYEIPLNTGINPGMPVPPPGAPTVTPPSQFGPPPVVSVPTRHAEQRGEHRASRTFGTTSRRRRPRTRRRRSPTQPLAPAPPTDSMPEPSYHHRARRRRSPQFGARRYSRSQTPSSRRARPHMPAPYQAPASAHTSATRLRLILMRCRAPATTCRRRIRCRPCPTFNTAALRLLPAHPSWRSFPDLPIDPEMEGADEDLIAALAGSDSPRRLGPPRQRGSPADGASERRAPPRRRHRPAYWSALSKRGMPSGAP